MTTVYKRSNRRWLRPKSGGAWGTGSESAVCWSAQADQWTNNKSGKTSSELNGSLTLQDCSRRVSFDLSSYNKATYLKNDAMLSRMIEEICKARHELAVAAMELEWRE